MTSVAPLEIFLSCAPGLEPVLRAELVENGFKKPEAEPGGVTLSGGWPEVWRAALVSRIANRVLVRVVRFRASSFPALDTQARRVDWAALLENGAGVRVEAACRKSRLGHSGAVAERIERAVAETAGAKPGGEDGLRILARIERDVCTISLDATGEPLHKRGYKQAVAKAPMRETLAAAFLRGCDYKGKEPVLDPMCGSGTFVIEAAEIASRRAPGRSRSFAFETLASFDPDGFAAVRERLSAPIAPDFTCRGFDRDAGAIDASIANAARASVDGFTEFQKRGVAELVPPDGPPGLVIVNPPYGGRVGEGQGLRALHRTMGDRLKAFRGWRVGLVTSEEALARATGLPFEAPGPIVDHGGLKIRLWRTGPLT
ncbi:MAG: class I SAM-dependent RNA methyltransferase [Oceanicaulis sp.]